MGKTMHLSMIEHGAYTVLLDAYYATEKPLAADYESLYRVCRAMSKAEKEAVRRVVDAFFHIAGDGLRHNPRADKEITTAQATIEKQRESALKSTVKRTVNNTVNHTVESDLTERSSGTQTGQPSTFNLQPLTTTLQPSTSNHQPPTKNISPGADATRRTPKPEPPTNAVWQSYADTYAMRYGTTPVRNAKVNGQLAQLVQRLGGEEAPAVAAAYVQHNKALYISANHCVDLLLRDCEGLRTQWANGRITTDTEARQMDRKQNHLGIAERLIAKQRAKHGQ